MEAVASPSQQRWQKRILALCRVSYALSYLCRTKLSIALPEMTAQLHWSAAKAGVIGSVFFISCGIGHLINGMLGDRIPVKKFMLLGLAGTSFCNLLIGFFPYCTVILLVWLVNGVLLSTLWEPVVRAVAIWYAPSQRNVPAMLVSASSLGGYLVSWAELGLVVQLTGWQGAFFFPGAVTLAFTIWCFLRMNDAPETMGFPNYERTAGQNEPTAEQTIGLWALVRRERLLFICFAAAARSQRSCPCAAGFLRRIFYGKQSGSCLGRRNAPRRHFGVRRTLFARFSGAEQRLVYSKNGVPFHHTALSHVFVFWGSAAAARRSHQRMAAFCASV